MEFRRVAFDVAYDDDGAPILEAVADPAGAPVTDAQGRGITRPALAEGGAEVFESTEAVGLAADLAAIRAAFKGRTIEAITLHAEGPATVTVRG